MPYAIGRIPRCREIGEHPKMDPEWGELLAVAVYKRFGFDPRRPVSTFRLARAWFGGECITRSQILMAHASTGIINGRRLIAVRRSLPVEYQAHAVGHELAHAILHEERYVGEDEEAFCDFIGACLVMPTPAVRELHKIHGRDFTAIAEEVVATETMVALRLAEVRKIPRVVVTPRKIYDRLPEGWTHPPDSEIRSWVNARRPGITKTKLRDDSRRVVLDIDDLAVG